LTTGAAPRRIAIPGADLDGVHYLRTLADCDVLMERLKTSGRVALVGAGWIGCEAAASARQCGLEVTLLDPHRLPFERIFGPEIGSFYRDVHVQDGVEMRLGESVAAFEGDGAMSAVRTRSGKTLDCDFVVVGIGVEPRVELASEAGLEIENAVQRQRDARRALRTQDPS
jgi:3-phenylpropionate/trans-cinnamate dioxygenase ferredoxin reductase component